MTGQSEKATIAIGVVGCGGIAQVAHLPALSKIDGVEVLAVCDDDSGRADTIARRFGVPTSCGSVEKLLAVPGIQAVIVCTPNHLHSDHCERALEAGMDVLCERPLAINREQADRLVRVAERAGRHLMVANNHRFRPDAYALKQTIERGELGKILQVYVSWLRRRTGRPRRRDWRRNRELAGGGVLMDMGVSNLDLGLWLTGYPAPKRVTAHVVDRDEDGLEDTASVSLGLEGDLSIGVDVSWDLVARDDRHTLFAFGSRGSGSLSPFLISREVEDGVVVEATPRLAQRPENVYTASYRRELEGFLKRIRAGEPPQLPHDQVTLMAVVDACYRSAAEGREVVL